MTAEEQIEYYLGKDRLPNVHWKAIIPPMWGIPVRQDPSRTEQIKNTTINDKFNQVEYQFNNLGYRSSFDYTADLKTKDIILLVGCSDAFGQLVEYNKSYASLIQDNVGKDYTVVSVAIAGASPDAATRVGTQSILYLQSAVKHVCMLWPVFSLREFVSKEFRCGVHTLNNHIVPYKDWWDHIDWVSNNYNYQKNKILIESICQANKIEYHDLIINSDDAKIPYDLLHFGPYTALGETSHQAIADYFIKKIRHEPSLFESTQS